MPKTRNQHTRGRARVGLAPRRIAAKIIARVLEGKSLDEQLDPHHGDPMMRHLPPRDRAFIKALTTLTCRRLGSLRHVLGQLLEKGMPKRSGLFEPILLSAATQILFMETASHAAVDQAGMLLAEDRHAKRYMGLANAVLRKLSKEPKKWVDGLPASCDLPDWLAQRWGEQWGSEQCDSIAAVLRTEPPLDVTALDCAKTADQTGGAIIDPQTVRIEQAGAVDKIPGFEEGAWWVQDVAASLPARLLKFAPGDKVADLCAAPGGKTAQLCARGSKVTAFDRVQSRLARLEDNLKRLGFAAISIKANLADPRPKKEHGAYAAVLLDAPCSGTGTIRRHPDIAWHRTPSDIKGLAKLQRTLLDRAAPLVAPGGSLVFSTCSLEPEEGEDQVTAFLARNEAFEMDAILPEEATPFTTSVTPQGWVRILPDALVDTDTLSRGNDGFFVVRFTRKR